MPCKPPATYAFVSLPGDIIGEHNSRPHPGPQSSVRLTEATSRPNSARFPRRKRTETSATRALPRNLPYSQSASSHGAHAFRGPPPDAGRRSKPRGRALPGGLADADDLRRAPRRPQPHHRRRAGHQSPTSPRSPRWSPGTPSRRLRMPEPPRRAVPNGFLAPQTTPTSPFTFSSSLRDKFRAGSRL